MHSSQRDAKRALLFLALFVALGLNIARIVWQYDEPGGAYDSRFIGLFDFHNGVYTPTRAYLDGVNPYGQVILDKGYPVSRPAPIYGPSHFLIHAPLAKLPVRLAEVLYCIFNFAMYAAMVYIPLHELHKGSDQKLYRGGILNPLLLGLTLVLLSRPGHLTFVSGYFTAELALGSIAVLWLAPSRPWLAALAFVLVCGKPTYALPVMLVLLILGFYRAFITSMIVGGLVNFIALGWLLRFESIGQLIQGIREGQAAHMADPIELPVNSWLRIDWTAIISKWLEADPPEIAQVVIMLILYATAAVLVRWRRTSISESDERRHFIVSRSGAFALGSILLFVYHHAYDALLLLPPIVAIATTRVEGREI